MKLLEREAATSQLRECLADADEGVARLIFLGGETGIGKTVFIRRFADSVRASTRVLHGACDALSHPAPPGPLHDAAPYLGRQVQGLLQDPDRRSCAGGLER
jgi:predicted ATPase